MSVIKVLWLAPSFNHYKARYLNHLAKENEISLTILSGTGRENMGDKKLERVFSFNNIKINVLKKDFGRSKDVMTILKDIFSDFNWVMIPAEKKNIPLFLYALQLRRKNKNVCLFSYNHPILKSSTGKITFIDKMLTKWFYKRLDRVIFYTEDSHTWALEEGLITKEKAYWANNTIDTIEVNKYVFSKKENLNPTKLLLIGRLIPYRNIDKLLVYFKELQYFINDIELHVIGSGPEEKKIILAKDVFNNIFYYGSLVDEALISNIMNKIDYVFVPGHSGLSINHSFAYEKPYITSSDYKNHPPEFGYLKHEENGLILTGDIKVDLPVLKMYLTSQKLYNKLVSGVRVSKKELSVENWVNQIVNSLKNE